MHPVILQQLAAEHLQQTLAEADDARRAPQVSRLASGGQQLHAASARSQPFIQGLSPKGWRR